MKEKCFACDRALGSRAMIVTTADGQRPRVGSDCYRRIKAAGVEGYQPPTGGPRLYVLKDRPPAEAPVVPFIDKARALLDGVEHDVDADTMGRIGVVKTFLAMIETALPLRRVVPIASAIVGHDLAEDRVRAALSSLVREKVLRSRRAGGETLWEVNA